MIISIRLMDAVFDKLTSVAAQNVLINLVVLVKLGETLSLAFFAGFALIGVVIMIMVLICREGQLCNEKQQANGHNHSHV